MALSAEHKKRFRSIGHNLNPVVTIADKGLSEGVSKEMERALDDHELIKVKLAVEDRQARQALIETLCQSHSAELVQAIGKTALLFRAASEPKLNTSNIR